MVILLKSQAIQPILFSKIIKRIAPFPTTYKGVRNWDSAFHLMAMSYIEPEIGYDQIRILFDFMKEDGRAGRCHI